jgi:pimeloyl-ACP methyl ester carboxylesterase/DNA-binding SARP family transcriptional activator
MGEARADIDVELRLMGPLRLWVDGAEVALPPSRKTRALLALLALEQRPQRRDRLCDMFWGVPDDPRGALRWSLSKLRHALGRAGTALVADRDTIALALPAGALDVRRLAQAAAAPATAPSDLLLAAASVDGDFLEGLDIPRCEAWEAWRIAYREDARRWRATVLAELARRPTDPDAGLPHARARVELDPFDPDAWEALLRLLDRAGRAAEARDSRTLCARRMAEAGRSPPPSLRQPALPDSTRTVAAVELPASLAAGQKVRFARAADAVMLAWSCVGDGPGLPLVKAANWMNHLEFDWDSPIWRHWIAAFAADRAFIRYDERGNGLSDWRADLSFDAFVADLEAVVEAAGLERFDLLGISQGAAVAVAYAVRHPGRVRRMILYGGYAMGWRARASAEEIARREAMVTLTRQGWGMDNPAFRQMFTSLFIPGADAEAQRWFNELQRISTSPENAVALQQVFADIDVRPLLPQVMVPTLVAHARDDAIIPFEAGRHLAAAIPGARFLALDSANHLLLEVEPAWARFVAEARAFLAEGDADGG